MPEGLALARADPQEVADDVAGRIPPVVALVQVVDQVDQPPLAIGGQGPGHAVEVADQRMNPGALGIGFRFLRDGGAPEKPCGRANAGTVGATRGGGVGQRHWADSSSDGDVLLLLALGLGQSSSHNSINV